MLHLDFSDFLKLLIEHQVKFLLVGAQALAVHGRPRFTGDLEVWVERSDHNAARLVEALAAFGFPGIDAAGCDISVIGKADFVASKRASGRPKDLLDIELLKEVDPDLSG